MAHGSNIINTIKVGTADYEICDSEAIHTDYTLTLDVGDGTTVEALLTDVVGWNYSDIYNIKKHWLNEGSGLIPQWFQDNAADHISFEDQFEDNRMEHLTFVKYEEI